jgi:poly(hydroxyalkanoate) depolymerase family esterase
MGDIGNKTERAVACGNGGPALWSFGTALKGGICGCVFLLAAAALVAPAASAATTVEVTGFGSNPGELRMFKHIPDQLPASAPLVVVMHGCTQNARTFADESGWTQIAGKAHAALVMPEQVEANNRNKCFNWFVPDDNRRDQGEALSIKQMVDKMQADHNIDPKRIFVTGLSAGGAMTSVMLATYPDMFAGGGIVAGLPYGCANSLPDALTCMSTGHPAGGSPMIGLTNTLLSGLTPAGAAGTGTSGASTAGPSGGAANGLSGSSAAAGAGGPMGASPMGAPPAGAAVNVPLPPGICLLFPLLCPANGKFTPQQLGDFVRRASNHTGPFPRVSIWHGSADTTVSPVNATEEMRQWTNVHGVQPSPSAQDSVKGYPHAVYKDSSGEAVVETYSITGMPHGQPIDPGSGADNCGTADQFVLDANICASFFIARFWGVTS